MNFHESDGIIKSTASWLSVFLSQLFQSGHFLKLIEKILIKVIWRTPSFVLYYDRFFILSYDFATPSVCSRRLKSIKTRVAGTADLPALERFLEQGEKYAARFGKGDWVVVAEVYDEIVGMKWIEVGKEHYEEENEYRFPLPEGSAWSYDTYVAPAYRAKGVWTIITDEAVHDLRQRSYHTIYSMVKAWNHPMINGNIRYGFRKRRQVVFIRVLFLRIYLEKNIDQTAENDAWRATFVFRKLRWYKGSLNT